jgi:hypothetical protein
MPQTKTMSIQEKLAIGMKAIELKKLGKVEEAEKLQREMIPMPPYLAKWAKKRLGADFLIKYGWNLSEADAEYGTGWLTR